MRALTLTAPWSGLVASGIKRIENRPLAAPKNLIGERFAIHASRVCDRRVFVKIAEIAPEIRPTPLWRVTSAIIGVATLVRNVTDQEVATGALDHMPDQRRFYFGPNGYVLADVIALPKPVDCKGMLGFWTIPDDIQALVDVELERARG